MLELTVFFCVPYPIPPVFFPFCFLSSQEFLPCSLAASKFFLISFKDKNLLIECRWIRFPPNLWRDNMEGEERVLAPYMLWTSALPD